jgi:hypothetical protein
LEVLRLKINLRMLLPVIAAFFVLPMFAQSARATSIDFNCGPLLCGGIFNANFAGGTASSANASGVTVVNDSGPSGYQGFNFTMAFDTTAGSPNFTLTEIGGNGTILSGTISNILSGVQLGGGFDIVDLSVSFASLPADFAAFLGTPSGFAANTNIYIQGSTGQSIDVNIQPVPEPATLLLFGSGLLGLGGLVRRKLNV